MALEPKWLCGSVGTGLRTLSAHERAIHKVCSLQVTTTNLSDLNPSTNSMEYSIIALKASQRLCQHRSSRYLQHLDVMTPIELGQLVNILPDLDVKVSVQTSRLFWRSLMQFFRGRRMTSIHFIFRAACRRCHVILFAGFLESMEEPVNRLPLNRIEEYCEVAGLRYVCFAVIAHKLSQACPNIIVVRCT